MNTHPLPVRVAMPPAAVPGLIETNSRTMFASPSSRVLASPAYLRSCGIDPTLAKEKMRVASPSVVCPSTTAWAPMRQPAPTRTWGPITAYGPTVTPASSSAPRATTAVGWTVGPADGAAAKPTSATTTDPADTTPWTWTGEPG